jgi:hypothetical protein
MHGRSLPSESSAGARPQIDASAPKDVFEVAQRLERFQNRIARRAMPLNFRADGARTISGRRRRGRRRAGRNFVPKFVLDPANLSAPERT